MKKIILGMMGIIMTGAIVTASAFALFSDTATVSGLSISAGTGSILIGDFFTPDNALVPSITYNPEFLISGMFPGFNVMDPLDPTKAYDLKVKNVSTTGVNFTMSSRLTTLPAGWGNNLTFAAQVLFQNKDDLSQTTGWLSLPEWQAGEVTLPGSALAPDQMRTYYVYIRVPNTYGANDVGYVGGPAAASPVGNEIAGQSLTGSGFTITGTQVVTP